MPGLAGFTVKPEFAAMATPAAQAMLDRIRHRGDHEVRLTFLGAACLGLAGGPPALANGWPGESDKPTATFGALDGFVSSYGKYENSTLFREAQSDIDRILALYDEGENAFYRELRGAFSFALWDGEEESFLLGSDRHGQRFLYWTADETKGEFGFSSELKAMLAYPPYTPELDSKAPIERLFFGHLLGERTWLRHVKLLPPGSILRWSRDSAFPERHTGWDFSDQTLDESADEMADKLNSLFTTAVGEARHGKERIYVALGGGFHSRQILAAATQTGGPPIEALTFGLREADECLAAEIAAQLAGAAWTFQEMGPEALWSFMDRAAYLSDGEAGLERAGFARAAEALGEEDDPVALYGGGAGAILDDDLDQRFQSRLRGPEYFQEFWLRVTQPLRTVQLKRCFQQDVAEEAPIEDYVRLLQKIHAPCSSREAWQSFRFFQLYHWRRRLHGGIEHLMGRMCRVCNPYLNDPVAEFGFHLPGHLRQEGRVARNALRRMNRKLALLRDASFAFQPGLDEIHGNSGAEGQIGQWFRGPWRDKLESLISRNDELLATWFNMDYVQDAMVEHAEGRADQSRLLLTLLHTLAVLRTLAMNRRYGTENAERSK